MNPQHIIAVEITDFKRLTAFKAQFDPSNPQGLVVLSGENEAGKSSVIDMIVAGITGDAPTEPIRKGQKKAVGIIKTQDLVITLKFTAAGKYLEVTNPEGLTYKKPMEMLTKGKTPLAFDPLAFAEMRGKAQVEELLRVCPVDIDLAANALEVKRLYDERAAANKEAIRREAVFSTLPRPMVNPPEKISVTDLSNRLEALRDKERGYNVKRQELKDVQRDVAIHESDIETTNNRIAEFEKVLADQKEKLSVMVKEHAALVEQSGSLTTEIAAFPSHKEEGEQIKSTMAAAEKTNALVEERRQMQIRVDEAEGEAKDARTEAERLDGEYKAELQKRTDAIAMAKFPVPDMTISDDDVILLKGIPIIQSSTAQKIKVGIALAAEASPNIRVAFVRDASLLDAKSMETLRELATAHNLQVWCERVSDASPGAIQIHDGTNAV
jgi:DNA repair exonuclease SbcCD ATPase subunit